MSPRITPFKIVLLAGIVLLVVVVFVPKLGEITKTELLLPDLCDHPAYNSYQFPKDKKFIHLGVQPLWVFEGNLAEIMKRDRILRGSLAERGLEISFYSFLKGDDVNHFVRRGDLHGGMCGDMPTLTIAAAMEVEIPALTDQGFNCIVAKRHMVVAGLKGKTIGYPFGSFSHFALLEALESEGMSEAHVNLVPMDVTDLPEAFRSGKIDAFAAWEPMVSLAMTKVPGSAVIHRNRYLGFIYFTKEFADSQPEAIDLILASAIRAVRWMLADRHHVLLSSEWAIQSSRKLSSIASEISEQKFAGVVMEEGKINPTPVIPQDDLDEGGHLHREFGFLKKLGKIPARSHWSRIRKMFNRQIVENVLANPEKYRLDQFDYDGGRGNE